MYKNIQTLGKNKFMLSKCSLEKGWPDAILLLSQVIFSLPHSLPILVFTLLGEILRPENSP